ncbi:serine hydrolase domain-containing protein [Nocardia carnea]|uniref:serine hydrolase domain-containing protein n=1 Tax=Nocardia carnea TaxID=37328 RepID=UPI002453D7CE|nr:serine hydrolase domain-containing protein [Nocardia carnea]
MSTTTTSMGPGAPDNPNRNRYAQTCDATVREVLRRAVTEEGSPGIVAEIRDTDEVRFAAFGTADTATGRLREPGERIRVGSLGKAFTATVVLRLEAEGRLSLDDPVEKWLPGLVAGNGHDGSRISVRQLLNQTSGIANIGGANEEMLRRLHTPAFRRHRFDIVEPRQMVEMTMSMPAAFEPGAGFGYSNTNFLLAGMIIEAVTGRSYTDEVARVVTLPLGMTGTYIPEPEERRIRGPHPHPRQYSKLMNPEIDEIYDATEMTVGWAGAAGGHVSTTSDMCRFIGALASGTLLPAPQHHAMWTTVSTADSGWIPHLSLRYGLGVFEHTLPGGVVLRGGGGGIHGSFTWAMAADHGDRVLVANVNNDWVHLDIFDALVRAEFTPDEPESLS